MCKPMPAEWHDIHAVNKIADDDRKAFYRRTVADKKPYFMRYIYPALMRQYNTYIKDTEKVALREFGLGVSELMAIPEDERTERQSEFLYYYAYNMPVSDGNCVMNKICRLFESAFDGFVRRANESSAFDYRILRSDAEYTTSQFYAVKRLYEEYGRRLKRFTELAAYERIDSYDAASTCRIMNEAFRRDCGEVCTNEKALCNIVLDLCYKRSGTKKFAWGMCGAQIIKNLLENNGGVYSVPMPDENGDIEYCGKRYSVNTIKAEVDNGYCSE